MVNVDHLKKIALFSVPRSGSTWLGQILNSHPQVTYKFQPNYAYSFEGELPKNMNKSDFKTFCNQMLTTTDPFVNGEISISTRQNIRFSKDRLSHLIFKETHALNLIPNLLENTDIAVIGLLRSPFAVINSWLKTPKEFKPEWRVSEQWREAPKKNRGREDHYFGFEKWKEGAEIFLKMRECFPDRFYLADYEKFVDSPVEETAKLYKFCDLKMGAQTRDFLQMSTSKHEADAYSVFKSKAHDRKWETNLPDFIIEDIKRDEFFREINREFQWLKP